ncbi:MAG: hypothetical protein ACXWWG_01305 [Nitrospira sp.]
MTSTRGVMSVNNLAPWLFGIFMGHKFIPDQIDCQVGWQCAESRSVRAQMGQRLSVAIQIGYESI